MDETPKGYCSNCGHEISSEDLLNGQDTAPAPNSKLRAFVLLGSIVCVMVVFLVVWLAPTPEWIMQSSQDIAKKCEASGNWLWSAVTSASRQLATQKTL